MQIISDLHLHSRYSRAVSQKMDLQDNAKWASKKGINLITAADWTHPIWFKEISTHLKEVEKGIYQIKENKDVSFILTTEISNIYSQGGKLRRIHNLIFSPSLETCGKIVKELQQKGAKLLSDGRPIIGLPAKDLLKLCLDIDENILFVPAHVWTPWFSVYGSNSGFDSLYECFGDLEKNVYAVETGLSSDPIMNWQIKELENRSILSFSDAHSGPKLGREATVFTSKNPNDKIQMSNISYADIVNAIKQQADAKLKIGYTAEFFPEEGKYHWSGHRDCGIRYSPKEVKEKGMLCPVCQRKLTIGVENRVLDLAHKNLPDEELLFIKNSSGTTFVYDKEKKRPPFVSLVPLLEILLEVNNNSQTKSIAAYENLVSTLGTEFDILIKKSYDEIASSAGKSLADAIMIIRERKVFVDPGFDGVFGKVKIFKEDEKTSNKTQETGTQTTLF